MSGEYPLLGIEFSEVSVRRTLFRTGDSEYAINGVPCRLLDVQELLSESELARYLGCDRAAARDLYLSRQIQAAEGGELVLELGEDVLGVTEAG